MASSWDVYFQEQIEITKKENRFRFLHSFDSMQPGYLIKNGESFLNLCSNDYLGLASDTEGREEAKLLAEIIPYGAAASRLITGNLVIHQELEKLLADWKRTEAALVFSSGYQTNIGLFSSLAGKGDAIFSDRLNHASIIDGCLLSGASFYRYPHNDLEELETMLKTKRPRKRIIVTDGVFSMDGDIALLPELDALAKKYDALLVVDEAHATGILGKDGAGSWSHYNLPTGNHVILMGTMSKAIGAQGGYICASQTVIEYLTNFSRGLIYSTALSPLLAGIIHYNITRIQTNPALMQSMQKAAGIMQKSLKKEGFDIASSPVPIIPLQIGDSAKAVAIAQKLLDRKIVALAIRPPTVPEGTARLRISVCAAHTDKDLQRAAREIAKAIKSLE